MSEKNNKVSLKKIVKKVYETEVEMDDMTTTIALVLGFFVVMWILSVIFT